MEDEVLLHLPEDIHKLCRTCMSVNVLSHDILLFHANEPTLAGEMLQFCFGMESQMDDGLPKSICDDCAGKLESAYNFKQQCEQTEAGLRKLLNLSQNEYKNQKRLSKQLINRENTISSDKGVILFESNLGKDFIENTSECDMESDINFDAIFQLSRSSSNLENVKDLLLTKEEIKNSSEVLKLIEDRKGAANEDENSMDYDDIFALIEERKGAVNTNKTKIKEEILSDNEESTNIFCSFCETFFSTTEDFENHSQACSNQIILQKLLKLENGDIEKVELLQDENINIIDNRRKFVCNICCKEFFTRHARNVHMSVHTNNLLIQSETENAFSCVLCVKIFPSESKLISHFFKHILHFRRGLDIKLNSRPGEFDLEVEIENDLLTCNVCQKQFECEKDLRNHTDMHLKSNIVCEICNQSFVGHITLVKHLKTHGSNISFCKICLKRFESALIYREHQKSHELENTKSKATCPICKEEFINLNTLKNHSVTHLNDVFSCERCGRHFNNKILYENHMKQHYEPRFLCSLCGKQYFSSATLECHLRAHNNEKPFECSHCKKRFTSRATLSVHKRIHSEYKPYICSYCGYSCRQSGDLAMHIRTHTGVKPYKCKFPNCERKFTTSSQRMEHHRRHTNERNHKCKLCFKAFLESKTLKIHMLTHTGEKPHECKVCGKRFRRSHHLSNHMKSHKDHIEVKLE